MAKTVRASSEKEAVGASVPATKQVRNAQTGKLVTVKGVGALRGSDLKIMKGVSLVKPIARQALIERPEKRNAG